MSGLKHYKTKAEAQAYIDGYCDGMSEAGRVLRKTEMDFRDYVQPELFMEDA